MSSVIDENTREEWLKILEEEKKLPVLKKGTRPNEEEMRKIQNFRQVRKKFTQGLNIEQQRHLGIVKDNASKINNNKKKSWNKEVHMKQLKALDEFAIKNGKDKINLIDIGINVQERFKKDEILYMFERAEASGTSTVILTGCSVKSSQSGLLCAETWYSKDKNESQNKKFPTNLNSIGLDVFATVGVHPHDAKTIAGEDGVFLEKLAEIRKMADNPFCVSLGECGLDYDRMFSPLKAQVNAFQAQVALAVELQKPLFVHLRERDKDKGPPLGAYEHAIKILNDSKINPKKVCVHCFTGDKNDLLQLTSKGFLIGFTGYIGMNKRATMTGTLEALNDKNRISLNQIMIETDTPFMRPDKLWFPEPDETGLRKGRNNEPSAMPAVCRALSSVYAGGEYKPHEIGLQTSKNAIDFFDLKTAKIKIKTK